MFLILWRRARTMDPRTILAGWFLLTTRNVARNALRQEWRLKRRERKVAVMHSEQTAPQPASDASSIGPVLDDALASLSEPDRSAILLRFFHAKSLREVGEALGLSEPAATKRVSRALGKLREILRRAGVEVPEEALASALPMLVAGAAAPGALVSAIQTGVAAGAASPGVAALAGAGAGSSAAGVGWAVAAVAAIALSTGAYVMFNAVADPKQTATTAPPTPAAPAAPAAPADPRTISIITIDPATNQPLADATVEVRGRQRTTGKTNAEGRYTLTFPTNVADVNATVRVTAPGRVMMEMWWYPRRFRGGVPPVWTVPLEAGTPIGGIVVDPLGNPLEGANIKISINSPQDDAPHPIIEATNIVTDAQGRWQVAQAPSKLDEIWVMATHPNFPGSEHESMPMVKVEQLRQQTLVSTVRAVATKLAGVVLDPDGKPLAGASVLVTHDRFSEKKAEATTDAEGRFSVAGFPRFNRAAIVRAPGLAPQMIEFNDPENVPPVEVRMATPTTIEGFVLLPDGTPLVGADVEVERWRKLRALEWKTRTDANGRFVWNEAPDDEVQFNVRAKGRMAIRGVPITAGGQPPKLVMYPPVRVTGSVIDAETKQPIPQFKITDGIRWTGQKDVTWQTSGSRRLTNGRYEATLDNISNGGRLLVEADGYERAESRMIEASEGNITMDFELKKASPK